MDIREIAFQQINANYSWGVYGDFKVIIDMRDGYINATNLCGLTSRKSGSKKEFRAWMLNSSSKELILVASKILNIERGDVTRVMNHSKITIRGTYVHPILIPPILSWADPIYSLKQSSFILNSGVFIDLGYKIPNFNNVSETKNISETFIYIIKNNLSSFLKIGRSSQTVEGLNKRYTTALGKAMTIYLFKSSNFIKDEKNIHNILKENRKTGEWFDIDTDSAIKVCSNVTLSKEEIHIFN